MSRLQFNTYGKIEMIKQFHSEGSLFAIESSSELCVEAPPENFKFFYTLKLLCNQINDGGATRT